MSFASPSFQLDEQAIDDDTHLIAVRGEVHVSTAPEFSDRLNDAIATGKTGVVIDMTDVAFIDSTGLSVLLNALRRVTRQQGTLALAVSNPTVLRLFEITRLDSTFDILPDREAAIARVKRGQAEPAGPSDQADGAGSSAGAP
ncbi:MAG TPA: STAS domain-containing protein [Solirubrobacteraceae bacterium]|nr:STAS domain-containing protein [Solirubrobacteraceae bacterium]